MSGAAKKRKKKKKVEGKVSQDSGYHTARQSMMGLGGCAELSFLVWDVGHVMAQWIELSPFPPQKRYIHLESVNVTIF